MGNMPSLSFIMFAVGGFVIKPFLTIASEY